MADHDELAKLLLDARNRALERLYPGGSDENDTWDKITTHQRSMLREQAAILADELPRIAPAISLTKNWKPGERVELVPLRRSSGEPRPGVVEKIDRVYGYWERLVVRFDDGETRPINPDVMRHIR